MEVKVTLKPGQNGTKRLVEQYGDQLVCVRYRYDKVKRKRYKTIELIINRHFGYVLRPARASLPHDPYAPGLHHFCFRAEGERELQEIAMLLSSEASR